MKNAFEQDHSFRASDLTPRRVRLTTPRVPRRVRGSAALPTILPSRPAPLPLSREEPIPDTTPLDDALQLYLREIGQVKLLTPNEEIALAKRIKRGDIEAREHMIKANLRLVVKIARDYEGLGLPLLD